MHCFLPFSKQGNRSALTLSDYSNGGILQVIASQFFKKDDNSEELLSFFGGISASCPKEGGFHPILKITPQFRPR
jgi:hypothetical protein